MVPNIYKRTKSPRLATQGNTFFGMKKELLIQSLRFLSAAYDMVFIDFDLSAAHTRIARYLLHNRESELDKSLSDPQFWGSRIKSLKPYFQEADILLDDKSIKKLLKVGLYTSLNGGNPLNEKRLIVNIALNATEYLQQNQIKDEETIMNSKIFLALKKAFENFSLISEVKNLNRDCATFVRKENDSSIFHTHTVDRPQPYILNSQHLGMVFRAFYKVLKSFY